MKRKSIHCGYGCVDYGEKLCRKCQWLHGWLFICDFSYVFLSRRLLTFCELCCSVCVYKSFFLVWWFQSSSCEINFPFFRLIQSFAFRLLWLLFKLKAILSFFIRLEHVEYSPWSVPWLSKLRYKLEQFSWNIFSSTRE